MTSENQTTKNVAITGRQDRKKTLLSTYVKVYMDLERLRVAQEVRISHLKLDNAPEAEIAPLQLVHDGLVRESNEIDKTIKKIVRIHPAWTGFLKDVKGVGEHLAGLVIGGIRDVTPLDTPSKVWYLCGLAVLEGKTQRKTKGEVINFDMGLKSILLGRIGDQLLKNRDPFSRKLYDEYKAYEFTRNPDITAGHAHRRAIRRVVKLLVSCMWRVWREGEGLPAANAYVIAHGGHTDEILAQHWIDYNEANPIKSKADNDSLTS